MEKSLVKRAPGHEGGPVLLPGFAIQLSTIMLVANDLLNDALWLDNELSA